MFEPQLHITSFHCTMWRWHVVVQRVAKARQIPCPPFLGCHMDRPHLFQTLLPCVQAISAEEGCTATAVLMWRDGQGDVCLQVCGAGRPGQQQLSMLPAAVTAP